MNSSMIIIDLRMSGLEVKHYRHYDPTTCGFDESGCYEDLKVWVHGSVYRVPA